MRNFAESLGMATLPDQRGPGWPSTSLRMPESCVTLRESPASSGRGPGTIQANVGARIARLGFRLAAE